MTFAAVTKNIKSMYSSSDFERLFIQGGSNATEEYITRIQDIKSYLYKSKDRRKRIYYPI